MPSLTTLLLPLLPLLSLTTARTDRSGCTSTTAGPSIIYYVPGTGELCDFLDCGGGRAPPKTTVPGCPQYAGTATYSPSFLPGFGAAATTSTPHTGAVSASPVVTGSLGSSSRSSAEGGVVTLTGTVTPSVSTVTSVLSESASGSLGASGTGGSTIIVTSTTSGTAASQATSSSAGSGSGSSPSSSSRTGTSTGTAAGATNTNAGAVNVGNGVVGVVAAGIAFLL
ncbi:hypothetical protein BKA65DRAFT_118044 [Rhexocercosporidium sp. MPI-PUGE-AT-0058]|nr:hypothetical protein BKA65DRAFT_118044 [Rhexocercosporidium sp. MPI-PUGE-AT-0058]